MSRILGLIAFVALASGCASQSTSGQATASNLSAKSDTEKVANADAPSAIKCKYIVQTGTRFGTQICMKNSDWARREKQAQENARQEMTRAALNAQQTQNMPGTEGGN